jgi:hypothetical protein
VVTKVGHLRSNPDESHGLVVQFTLPDGRVVERSLSDESERLTTKPCTRCISVAAVMIGMTPSMRGAMPELCQQLWVPVKQLQ